MSISKFESEIKHLQQPAEAAFARMADLRHLESLKQRLGDPAVAAKMAEQIPAEKIEETRRYLEELAFDEDCLSLRTPVGPLTLRIVEREAPKLIKLASEGAPIQLFVWIQLLPEGETASKMRVTVGAELSVFMKGMAKGPLQQAADGLANILANIPPETPDAPLP